MTRAALLVIDLLEDFLRAWDAPGRARLLRAANELIAMARERDVPVIVGSYDREHEAVTLRYLDGKIASVLDNAQVRRRLEIGMTA